MLQIRQKVTTRVFAMFSAGGGSWRAAKLARMQYPDAELRLVFVDTIYEDADAYRFLLEGAANVFGRKIDWAPRAEDFPDYRVSEDLPIEEYSGNPEWRGFLADLRRRAASEIPKLIWLVEGRDPWEIFRDERFLGNSRRDPCSKVAKRQVLDRWRKENCDPFSDVFVVGIGEHERHRFDGGKGRGKGLGPRMAEKGWRYEAPLLGKPEWNPTMLMEREGLRPPRLYSMGYMHNNCGGMCVKAGYAHWQNRYRVHPERFAYDAMMERKIRAFLDNPSATMLNDRRGGGKKKPLSLDAFGLRVRDYIHVNPTFEYEYEPGSSGCGCMTDV